MKGGATATGARFDNGDVFVSSGGIIPRAVAGGGAHPASGRLMDSGAAYGTTLGNGEIQYVARGGLAVGTKIGTNAVEAVLNGGKTSSAVVGVFGKEQVGSGGSVDGIKVLAGGTATDRNSNGHRLSGDLGYGCGEAKLPTAARNQ